MATDVTPADNSSDEIGSINKYNFRTETQGVFKAKKGLSADVVHQISDIKGEPDWMREFRLRSLEIFERTQPKFSSPSRCRLGVGILTLIFRISTTT